MMGALRYWKRALIERYVVVVRQVACCQDGKGVVYHLPKVYSQSRQFGFSIDCHVNVIRKK